MHRKVAKHLHNFFVPHEGNDHLPHSVRHHSLAAYAALLVAAKAFLVLVLFTIFPSIAEFSTITQNRVAELVNQTRATEGLEGIVVSPVLQSAAQLKLNDMIARDYFSHDTPEGNPPWIWFKEAGYVYTYAGENLAMNFVEAEDVHAAWMASPTHRANIVNPNYKEIGVAVGVGEINGEQVTLVVQMFGTTFVPPSLAGEPLVPTAEPTVKGEETTPPPAEPVPPPPVPAPAPAPAPTPPVAAPTPPPAPAPVPPVELPAEPIQIPSPPTLPTGIDLEELPATEERSATPATIETPDSADAGSETVTFVFEEEPTVWAKVITFLRQFSFFIVAFVVFALLLKVVINIKVQHKRQIILALIIILIGILLLLIQFHFLESVQGPVIIN